jgi:hypothetical protein
MGAHEFGLMQSALCETTANRDGGGLDFTAMLREGARQGVPVEARAASVWQSARHEQLRELWVQDTGESFER